MAITIAICVAAFIWIYVRVGPFLSDFVPASSGDATPTALVGAVASPVATPSPTSAPSTPTPTAVPTPAWQATHHTIGDESIYFRSGPTVSSDPVTVLAPGTELQFLGDQQQTGASIWMHFKLEDGREGWVRQIDVDSVSP